MFGGSHGTVLYVYNEELVRVSVKILLALCPDFMKIMELNTKIKLFLTDTHVCCFLTESGTLQIVLFCVFFA